MTEVSEIVRQNSGFVNVLLHCSLAGMMKHLGLRVIMNYHFFFVFLSMYDSDKLLKVITILSLFLRNLTQFEESAKKKTLSFVEVTVTRQNTLFDSKSALTGQKPIVHCTGKSTEN